MEWPRSAASGALAPPFPMGEAMKKPHTPAPWCPVPPRSVQKLTMMGFHPGVRVVHVKWREPEPPNGFMRQYAKDNAKRLALNAALAATRKLPPDPNAFIIFVRSEDDPPDGMRDA